MFVFTFLMLFMYSSNSRFSEPQMNEQQNGVNLIAKEMAILFDAKNRQTWKVRKL